MTTGNSTTSQVDRADTGVLTTVAGNAVVWHPIETMPTSGPPFLALGLYEPETYSEPMAGMEVLTVEPEPTPLVLANWRQHTRQYETLPWFIPLGPEWRIIGWQEIVK